MTTDQPRIGEWRPLWPSSIILLAGFAAHGMLLFTDYVIWDGWWYAGDLRRPEGPAIMTRLFHEVGRPLDMFFYLPFSIAGSPVALAKVLSVFAWIGSGVLMARVLAGVGGLPVAVSTAIAVLAVTSPVFDLLGELSLWMNTACVLLFWLAWVLVSLMRQHHGGRRIALRIVAIILLFISFNLNSLLVMFYAVAALVFVTRLSSIDMRSVRHRFYRLGVRYADFLVLPVTFWLWKTCLTPSNGFYINYNKPSLDPVRLASGYAGMLIHMVASGILEFFASSDWLGVSLAVGVIVIVLLRRWNTHIEGHARSVFAWAAALTVAGIFLLLAAAFPYIAVGQNLASEGWLTRNAILCNLPIALILVGVAAQTNRLLLPDLRVAWIIAVCVLSVLGIGNCQRNYLALQAYGAKQQSIRQKLIEAIQGSGVSVVQLRDYYQIPGTIPYYPPLIWTYIASGYGCMPETFVFETATMLPDQVSRGVRGEEQRVVPQVKLTAAVLEQAIIDTTMPYALEGIPRNGRQMLLAIVPGKYGNDGVALGLRYLWLRWFDRSRLAEFVTELTESQLLDLPSI